MSAPALALLVNRNSEGHMDGARRRTRPAFLSKKYFRTNLPSIPANGAPQD